MFLMALLNACDNFFPKHNVPKVFLVKLLHLTFGRKKLAETPPSGGGAQDRHF